jgi:hypothetical protein
MRLFSKKDRYSGSSRADALACTPVKSREMHESRLDTGEVLIRYPVRWRPWMVALARRLGREGDPSNERKLQLDELGTMVWDLIDGRRTVQQIIRCFSDAHQLQAREAEVAVTQFLRQLGKRGLIGLL